MMMVMMMMMMTMIMIVVVVVVEMRQNITTHQDSVRDIRCEFQKVVDAHGEEVSGHLGRGHEHINYKGLTSVECKESIFMDK